MRKSLNTSALVTADSEKARTAIQLFRAQYNKARLDEDSAQILNEHPGFAAYLLAGIRRFSVKAPDYALAQSILGIDFITPEEVTEARPNVVYTAEQITALAQSLPSLPMLMWCEENGYAIMPAPPRACSTVDIQEIKSTLFRQSAFSRWSWFYKQSFAKKNKTSFGWLLIKKTPVENSKGKMWREQKRLLSLLEKVPNAAEMSWFITTYFEVRDVRLFGSVSVRTSDLDSDGNHVDIGRFEQDGLGIGSIWGDFCDAGIGLSAARKQ